MPENATNNVPGAGFDPQAMMDWVQTKGQDFAISLLVAIAILVVGSLVAKIVRGIILKATAKKNLDPTVSNFVASFGHALLMTFVIIAALGSLGVPVASFVAIIGAVGLAVGLALQGSLANFAAGFLMIIFRPFKKGDYVEGGGTAGVVDEIQIFTTILNTPDNKKVIVPNAKMMGDNITNYSAKDTRRIDLTFGIGYGDDIPKAKAVLMKIVEGDERVLKEPAPQILVGELGDSSVNLIMRVWLKSGDYWSFNFDTIEKVKLTFDKEGISIPFPQRDVHLFNEK